MFEHPRTHFTLDFPKGPLAVGGDYLSVDIEKLREWTERESSAGAADHRYRFRQFLDRLQ